MDFYRDVLKLLITGVTKYHDNTTIVYDTITILITKINLYL